MNFIMPGVAGIAGVLVMTVVMRRASVLHLPETQMIRAIGAIITKDADRALWPGFVVHLIAGTLIAYLYMMLLSTAPLPSDGNIGAITLVVACTLMGLVHGVVVTLFLVISVAQYHPIEQFRRLNPGDMAAHVIGHLAYGAIVGLMFGQLGVL